MIGNEYLPTDSELEILQILWQEGEASVRSINDKLNEKREIGYTTTLKIMQLMHDKGLLVRNTDQRSHVYQSAIPEKSIKTNLVQQIITNAFQGSAKDLVMAALGTSSSTPKDLEEIRLLIDSIEQNESI